MKRLHIILTFYIAQVYGKTVKVVYHLLRERVRRWNKVGVFTKDNNV